MSDDALSQITDQLANSNNPDPITDAINRQTQTVADYTIRFVIPQERQYRLIRALVLFDLYSNPALGMMPPNVETTYKAAMQELKDIRDGKFPDLALLHPSDGSEAPASDSAAWGSDKKINMRRGGFGNWGCE
jgi:hypothetical protein